MVQRPLRPRGFLWVLEEWNQIGQQTRSSNKGEHRDTSTMGERNSSDPENMESGKKM